MTIYINGRFLTQKITGVQRYAIEVVKEIDKLNLQDEIIILHPKNIINKLELKNIKLKQIGNITGHLWEQTTLPIYIMKKNKKAKLINFCNTAPVLFPGYVVLHDISFKTHSEHLNWKFALWYKIVTTLNIKRYKHIFTDSEFSKKEISDNYNAIENKITVTYVSAEHMKKINPDYTIIKKLNLENKEFYFSLGSKSPHKNHEYIIECAKNNSKLLFVVSGNDNEKVFKDKEQEKIENILYTGYISDNELVALYKKCKAFIFPSLYEGFGLPPLEAIVSGCKNVIVSDIPVFKEIYGNNVNYIKNSLTFNIGNKNNELDEEFLKKYSWNKIADIIYKTIRKENI